MRRSKRYEFEEKNLWLKIETHASIENIFISNESYYPTAPWILNEDKEMFTKK
jgi:hypothetical protein